MSLTLSPFRVRSETQRGFSAFVFRAADNPQLLTQDVTGQIDPETKTITLVLPRGVNPSSYFSAWFQHDGLQVKGSNLTAGIREDYLIRSLTRMQYGPTPASVKLTYPNGTWLTYSVQTLRG